MNKQKIYSNSNSKTKSDRDHKFLNNKRKKEDLSEPSNSANSDDSSFSDSDSSSSVESSSSYVSQSSSYVKENKKKTNNLKNKNMKTYKNTNPDEPELKLIHRKPKKKPNNIVLNITFLSHLFSIMLSLNLF